MQKIISSLRALGPLGSGAANLITFATTNWVLTMSTVLGLWASLTDKVVTLAESPRIHTAILVFLTILWTSVGIAYLIDRRKPRFVRAVPDYRYGLTFEGLHPNIDPMDDGAWLAFTLAIRNYSQAPIKYTVEKFDVRIGSRALPKPGKILSGYLPRGGAKGISPSRFKKDEVREFFGKRAEGTAEITLVYGHPEEPPVRRLRIDLNLILHMADEGSQGPMGWGADIVGEQDEALASA